MHFAIFLRFFENFRNFSGVLGPSLPRTLPGRFTKFFAPNLNSGSAADKEYLSKSIYLVKTCNKYPNWKVIMTSFSITPETLGIFPS